MKSKFMTKRSSSFKVVTGHFQGIAQILFSLKKNCQNFLELVLINHSEEISAAKSRSPKNYNYDPLPSCRIGLNMINMVFIKYLGSFRH